MFGVYSVDLSVFIFREGYTGIQQKQNVNMPRKSSRYLRDALLLLKSQTDQAPMIFQARYVHQEGRWCTFAQVSVVYPTDIGSIDCGHINITRSVVEFHQPLGKSDHHRMVHFVARVASYWYHGDRRGKVMLERLSELPSIWLSTASNEETVEHVVRRIEEHKVRKSKD